MAELLLTTMKTRVSATRSGVVHDDGLGTKHGLRVGVIELTTGAGTFVVRVGAR